MNKSNANETKVIPRRNEVYRPKKITDKYRLELILGPMGSGKSTELGRRIRVKKIYKGNVLTVTHEKDDRYAQRDIITHDGSIIPAIRVNSLYDLLGRDDYKNADVVGIDEGQFFPEIYDFIVHQLGLDNSTKSFIVAGLSGDKDMKAFGKIISLIPVADVTDILKAKCTECKDGTDAAFTVDLVPFEGQEKAGGMDLYTPVCRFHHQQIKRYSSAAQKELTSSTE